MAWQRRLYLSRTTFMISIPKAAVDGMGLKRGDAVRLEHPFSDSLIVTPIHEGIQMKSAEEMRAMGWLTGGGWHLVQLLALGAEEIATEQECEMCKRWVANYHWGGLVFCRFCARELEAAVCFRRRPVQGEMELLLDTIAKGGTVAVRPHDYRAPGRAMRDGEVDPDEGDIDT